jgi:hypothetical protein
MPSKPKPNIFQRLYSFLSDTVKSAGAIIFGEKKAHTHQNNSANKTRNNLTQQNQPQERSNIGIAADNLNKLRGIENNANKLNTGAQTYESDASKLAAQSQADLDAFNNSATGKAVSAFENLDRATLVGWREKVRQKQAEAAEAAKNPISQGRK